MLTVLPILMGLSPPVPPLLQLARSWPQMGLLLLLAMPSLLIPIPGFGEIPLICYPSQLVGLQEQVKQLMVYPLTPLEMLVLGPLILLLTCTFKGILLLVTLKVHPPPLDQAQLQLLL